MSWDTRFATLLTQLFSNFELLQWVGEEFGASCLSALPGPRAPRVELATAAVAWMMRRGYVNDELFDTLSAHRHERASEVEAVRARWQSERPRAAAAPSVERAPPADGGARLRIRLRLDIGLEHYKQADLEAALAAIGMELHELTVVSVKPGSTLVTLEGDEEAIKRLVGRLRRDSSKRAAFERHLPLLGFDVHVTDGLSATQRKRCDDYTLHVAFVDGDREAGSQLCGRHYTALTMFFRRRIPHLADDLVNDVFMTYVQKAASAMTTNIRAFLFGIANMKFLSALRRISRHPEDKLPSHSIADLVEPGVNTVVADRQEVRRLLEALQSLPTTQQTVIELMLFEGYSYAEVAEVLQAPVNTCRGWKSKGVAALRKQLGSLKMPLKQTIAALYELNSLRLMGLHNLYPEASPAELEKAMSPYMHVV